MPWQQLSPGHYQRPFDTIERLFYHAVIAGRDPQKGQFFLSSAVKLKHDVSTESLRQAWVALHYKHPQIAAVPG